MKKILIIFVFSTVLSLMASPVAADPNLYFDFDNDGEYDISWEISGTESVEIYIDDWPAEWSSEDILGAQIYFYYDDTKIQVNEGNSFANDDDNGGGFDPDFSEFNGRECDTSGIYCNEDDDCLDGTCTGTGGEHCRTDDDCLDGTCTGTGEEDCRTNDDCPEGETCTDGGIETCTGGGFETCIITGKIQLIVGGFGGCQEIIDNKILLWTLELQSIDVGTSDITIQVDYNEVPAGAIIPGGADCGAPHEENAVDGYAEITTSLPEPVPTLTEWGMIFFMTIMMGTGVMVLRKRRMV